jgi:hypothetical protein
MAASSIYPWKMFGDPAVATAHPELTDLPHGALSKIVVNNSFGLAGIIQYADATAYRGKVLTLRGQLRASGTEHHSVGLWLRADDASGNALSLENMSDSRLVGQTPWTAREISLYVPANAHRLRAGVLISGVGTVEVAGLELSDRGDKDLTVADPPLSPAVQELLGLIERQSLRFAPEYKESMVQMARASRGADSSDLLEFKMLGKLLLQRIGDYHSVFIDDAKVSATEVDMVRSSPVLTFTQQNVPVIKIPSIDTFDLAVAERYAVEARKLLHRVQGQCGIIIDLRENFGGNMWPMLAAIAPVLPNGVIGGFSDRLGRFEAWKKQMGSIWLGDSPMISAGAEIEWTAPKHIGVLFGSDTASSGEAVIIALKSNVESKSFGVASAGLTSGNQKFEISNGTAIMLETTQFSDFKGSRYDGPIVPDVVSSNAMEAASEWITSKCRVDDDR